MGQMIYLIKPYEFDELTYADSCASSTHRAEFVEAPQKILKHGELILDIEQHLARYKGQYVDLY